MNLLPSYRRGGAWIDDAWTYRGMRTVVLGNDRITVVVVPDKGADIVSVVHRPTDTELLWCAPNGLRDLARAVPATGDAAQTWLDQYEGGWQTVVPNGGAPSELRGAQLGQHAEANLVPWDAAVVNDGPERVELICRVDLPRTPLRLRKSIALGAEDELIVSEAITNTSPEALSLVYGHHIVFGAPFLESGCRIEIPGCELHAHPERYADRQRLAVSGTGSWPHLPAAAGGMADLSVVPGPEARTLDLAYATDLAAGSYRVVNEARGVTAEVRFPSDVFRCIWMWQSYGGGDGYPWWGRAYNLGLEPFTGWPNLGLATAVGRGTASTLGAHATVHAWIELRVIAGRTST